MGQWSYIVDNGGLDKELVDQYAMWGGNKRHYFNSESGYCLCGRFRSEKLEAKEGVLELPDDDKSNCATCKRWKIKQERMAAARARHNEALKRRK